MPLKQPKITANFLKDINTQGLDAFWDWIEDLPGSTKKLFKDIDFQKEFEGLQGNISGKLSKSGKSKKWSLGTALTIAALSAVSVASGGAAAPLLASALLTGVAGAIGKKKDIKGVRGLVGDFQKKHGNYGDMSKVLQGLQKKVTSAASKAPAITGITEGTMEAIFPTTFGIGEQIGGNVTEGTLKEFGEGLFKEGAWKDFFVKGAKEIGENPLKAIGGFLPSSDLSRGIGSDVGSTIADSKAGVALGQLLNKVPAYGAVSKIAPGITDFVQGAAQSTFQAPILGDLLKNEIKKMVIAPEVSYDLNRKYEPPKTTFNPYTDM